jgi:hypothetical protein
MKLPIIKKIQKEDLQTGEKLPAWVDRMLSPLNQFIEQVGIAVTGRLTFGDNMAGKFVDEFFVHNVAKELNPNDPRIVYGLAPVFCSGDIVVGSSWTVLSNGNLSITLLFNGAGTDSRSCRLLILFK